MKQYLKKILPVWCKRRVKCIAYSFKLIPEYVYWFWRDLWYSNIYKNEKSELASLMVTSHVLEKGITMPERRYGFAYDRVRSIINSTKDAIRDYSKNHIEIQSTLKDLEQYLQLHKDANFQLPEDILLGADFLMKYKVADTANCFESTPSELFKLTNDFYEFAHSRHTCRWYSNIPVDKSDLIKSIKLAQTAPSACNRQSTKTYVIETEEKKQKVLNLQNGNRGFGHLADKIILITADMRCWSFMHRTSAYLDAGIFTMNLLYSLHYYRICACTLNAHLKPKQRKQLRNIVGYSKSEMPVVFIAIDNAPEHFMIAGSQRFYTEQICQFV